MDDTPEDQAAISKFLAQNMADHLLFPMMERQRTHNMMCVKIVVGSILTMLGSAIYGANLPYGSSTSIHIWIFCAGLFAFLAAIPIGIYGWTQRHYLERITLLMNQIVIKNS